MSNEALTIENTPIYYRKPSETPAAWAAFVLYRNLGPNRTITEASKQLGKSTPVLCNWSVKYNWKVRALAYDREREIAEREAELEAIREMKKRHIADSLLKQDIGRIELSKIKKHATENEDALALDPALANKIHSEGIKEERLSRGEPNEITHTVSETPLQVKELTIDQIAILRGVHAKLKTSKDSEKDPENDDIDGDNETDIIDI